MPLLNTTVPQLSPMVSVWQHYYSNRNSDRYSLRRLIYVRTCTHT